MAFNPLDLVQLGPKLQTFKEQHPKVPAFIKKVGKDAIEEGTIIEVKVTSAEGRDYITNMKLTAEDVDLIRTIFGQKNE